MVSGTWIYQNDDNANYAQEWAFQLIDPTNNAYRVYNRNSRLAMRWAETASRLKDNSGSLFQDNLDCNSKYEIFRLIESNISGSCMLALDTANGTSYVTASAGCKVVQDLPAEGFPIQQSQPTCQWMLLQKTGNTSTFLQVVSKDVIEDTLSPNLLRVRRVTVCYIQFLQDLCLLSLPNNGSSIFQIQFQAASTFRHARLLHVSF